MLIGLEVKYEKVCSKNFNLSSDRLRMCKYYTSKLDYTILIIE